MRYSGYYWPMLRALSVCSGAFASAVVEAPPPSLDRSFPPQAATPDRRERMAELGFAFSALFDDLEERDILEARRSVKRFSDRCREVAGLVPEWRVLMPAAALEPLAAALRTGPIGSGDVARSRTALLRLRVTCAAGHGPDMTREQPVFHWGDFRKISALDPIAAKPVPFSALKWSRQDCLVGLMTDARQQQRSRVQQRFREFAARFDALRTASAACHGAEIPKYAGAAIVQKIAQMRALPDADVISAEQVKSLAREVDKQCCHEGHLVHLPAAKARTEYR